MSVNVEAVNESPNGVDVNKYRALYCIHYTQNPYRKTTPIRQHVKHYNDETDELISDFKKNQTQTFQTTTNDNTELKSQHNLTTKDEYFTV